MSKNKNVLTLEGAKENNLKDVSLAIPHNQFVAITGLSGSGKSSLAFSTVYAEGQRRYIETFSPYTRQFLDKVKRPALQASNNVRPAIAIQQKTRINSSRSTVGSITNSHELLKLLWTHLSVPVNPKTGKPLKRWTATEVAQELKQLLEKNNACLITSPVRFPLLKYKEGFEKKAQQLHELGYSRFIKTDSLELARFEEELPMPNKHGRVYVLLDRVKATKTSIKRLEDSVAQAMELSKGSCYVVLLDQQDNQKLIQFHNFFVDPEDPSNTDFYVPAPKPGLFDYNSPLGACHECRGFGKILVPDPEKIIPNIGKTLVEGALACWQGDSRRRLQARLIDYCEEQAIPTDKPWHKLKKKQQDLILNTSKRGYKGAIPWLKSLERKSYKMHVRVFLARYRSQVDCPECQGTRFQPAVLYFKIKDKCIPDIYHTAFSELVDWIDELSEEYLSKTHRNEDLAYVVKTLKERINILSDLGLSYLSFGRPSRTLSGGETQRVNLAAALGSDLVSTQFVLDEPSVGLHPRDTKRLITSLQSLTSKGNSVLVVEHDLDCLDAADHIIELGPAAGEHGGEVTYSGKRLDWKGIPSINATDKPNNEAPDLKKKLSISNANPRNLKDLSCDIPLECFVALTGVSGSGKSTLVSEVILKQYELYQAGVKNTKGPNQVKGFQQFEQVLLIDQSGLAKSPRANIATYSSIWDRIRTMFAATEGATRRSLTKSAFSFNVEGGRCPACKGAGYIKEDMQFLSDVFVQCEICLGKRFQQAVLEVTLHDKNVYELLQTSILSCSDLFFADEQISKACETLIQLGLGHLTLGHPLSELSGGEAQRLKLVPFIGKSSKGKSLLIFDEPSTGLHLHDVQRLIKVFANLRAQGHSILCIEHNQELILAADWIIDLGPEAGVAGGQLVLTGTPKEFLKKKNAKKSFTAHYLQDYATNAVKLNDKQGTKRKQQKTEPAPLSIKGAREHNLKNIDINIPHDCIVAITGVSGSGKSSIAKDIIYAEGQRRYLDCLSPYARQFIREVSKPDIDQIHNVRPSICVHQHTFKPGKLSTLGTMSEVYNFLRLLYSKVGQQYCPKHPEAPIDTVSGAMIVEQLKKFGSQTVRLLAPIIKLKKGNHKAVFARARSQDITEVRVDGVIAPVGNFDEGLERHKVHSIDFVWGKFIPSRVPEHFLAKAIEEVFALSGGTVVVLRDKEEHVFSRMRACPECGQGFFRPDPEDLSFHSKRGRCKTCEGTGHTKTGKLCSKCTGSGLNEIGRNIRLNDKNIYELAELNAAELKNFFKTYQWPEHQLNLITPVLRETNKRLDTLIALALDYLPLSRSCNTLSTGELQRLRLAAAMGTPLSGSTYIFDEPTAGLHPSDNERVLNQLQEVKAAGNSVIVIEHDEGSILSSDYVLEVGPGGGAEGGEIVFSGPIKEFKKRFQKQKIEWPEKLTGSSKKDKLSLKSGNFRNIKNLKLDIPLQSFVTVAGVSGAGKSSLVHGILLETIEPLKKAKNTHWKTTRGELSSDIPIDRVLIVDQSPVGKNSRSTPASYLGIWTHIRNLFANSIEAKARGWNAGFFSYNSGNGRCQECKGMGQQKLEMSFLADARVTCEFCDGERFGEQALSVSYLGKNIAEVLQMTFEEAKTNFSKHGKIHRILHNACDLGLGYLTLGQSSTTLSGGECQRLKLVSELSSTALGHTLYVLDEPTRGLHKKDVALLLRVLRSLCAKGHSILVVEHDHDVLRQSDYIVELGPGAGEQGGKLIYKGTPEKLKGKNTPWGQII